MNPTILNLPGFDAQLTRKCIKNINVRIDRNGHVNVSAPMRCPLNTIQQFLQKKQDWIMVHQARLRNDSFSATPSLQSGEQPLFLGQSYLLMIHEHAEQSRVVVEAPYLCCYVKSIATHALN